MRKTNLTISALLFFAMLLLPPSLAAQVQGVWTLTGNMNTAREYNAVARLKSGKVLVAGGTDGVGVLSSAEVFNPASGKWMLTGNMTDARQYFPAVTLSNGKVLVAGGLGTSGTVLVAAEVYDPTTGTWSSAGDLSVARYYHTATLLKNGEVLVAGGVGAGGTPTAECELYNPVTNTWSTTGSLATGRLGHTATLLTNGKVLVVGGSSGQVLRSCELYDPTAGIWSAAPNTTSPRSLHAATAFKDGKVLITGGNPGRYASNSAEIYDPSANTWTPTGSMSQGRFAHTSTLLTDGIAVVAGGGAFRGCGRGGFCFYAIATAETYNEATGQFTSIASLSHVRAYHTASPLGNGMVMVDGGNGYTSPLGSAEFYTLLTLTINPYSLDFGLLEVGLTSASQPVTITNVSSNPVSFKGITITGDFAQTNDCPAMLEAKQNCTVNVTFSPRASGGRNGLLTLSDNSIGSPHQTIALAGMGEPGAMTLLPSTVAFGGVLVGTSSQKSVTLTNDGAAPVNITGMAISPSDGTFTQTNNCPATLNPGQNCVFQVVFTPRDNIDYSGTLSVTDSAKGSPQTVPLSGTGADN